MFTNVKFAFSVSNDRRNMAECEQTYTPLQRTLHNSKKPTYLVKPSVEFCKIKATVVCVQIPKALC